MKDAAHHIKHVQKKVIQSSRKSSGSSKNTISEKQNGVEVLDTQPSQIMMKKADTNHRTPVLRTNRSMVH